MPIELLSAMINLRKTMKDPEFALKLNTTIVTTQRKSKADRYRFEPSNEEMKQAYNL